MAIKLDHPFGDLERPIWIERYGWMRAHSRGFLFPSDGNEVSWASLPPGESAANPKLAADTLLWRKRKRLNSLGERVFLLLAASLVDAEVPCQVAADGRRSTQGHAFGSGVT